MHTNFYLTKKNTGLVAAGIFLAIFLLLGLPFTQWGFLHDDFGVIYHAWIAGGSKLKALFTEGSMTAVVQPSNYIVPEQSFFAVLYRPLVYIFLHAQMLIVGINPYALLLITIFFHALNTVLLFYLLLGLIHFWEALAVTLLFAFHLSYWDWMGWIAGQNQVVNVTLVLLMLMFIKNYLDDTKYRLLYLSSASVLYGISLFYREEALILPFWLLISIPVYLYYKKPTNTIKQIIRQIIKVTSVFWLVTGTYFLLRLLSFPLKSMGAGIKGHLNLSSFFYSLKDRFFDVVTFLSDIANLAWLPGGNRLLKGSLLALFLTIILWLFYKNKHKFIILFCCLSMIMFMWPAFWRYYSSRFLYLGLPFLLVALVLLVTRYRYTSDASKNRWLMISSFLCCMLTITNAALLFSHLKTREHQLHQINRAYAELAKNEIIKDKTLCFIGLPYDTFVTGVAQAMWLNGLPANIPVYYDNTTFVWRDHDTDKNNIRITPTDNGFRLTSLDHSQAWFACTNTCMPMGTKTVHQEVAGKIFDMSYHVDKKYTTDDTVWITWDYEQQKFKMLT